MAGWQVTVINGGAPVTKGGILFDTGETVIGAATLELLSALGLVNDLTAPDFTFNFGEVEAMASASVVFTLVAAGHIV